MAYSTSISPGAAPLLWSSVQEAFDEINQNFTELQLFFNDSTITPIDLTNLHTDLSPAYSQQYSLGEITKQWKSVYLAEYTTIPGNEINGVWLGSAHIKGIGYTVDLPINSTVDGELIIDPSKTFFSSIQVDNSNSVEAAAFNSTLNINSGTSIQIVVDSSAESIEINNTGVTQLSGTAGQIGVSGLTGNITLTNLGVLNLSNGSTLPAGRPAGLGIATSGSTGNITLTNTGVIGIIQGPGITVSADTATGQVQISNAAPAQVAYRTIHIVGDSIANDLVADSTSDTLNIDPGYGIILSANGAIDPANDIITISVNPRIDIIGSVYADDSTRLVDGVDGKIVGDVDTNFLTADIIYFGSTNQGVLKIDSSTDVVLQNFVSGGLFEIKTKLGIVDQTAISINPNTQLITINGYNISANFIEADIAGSVFADNSTLLVNGIDGKLVGPIDSSDGINSIIMDPVSGLSIVSTSLIDIQGAAGAQIGIGAGTSGDIYLGSGSNQIIVNGVLMAPTIDTADSSAIQVIPSVNLNSDLTVGGDIIPNIDLGGNLGSPTNQWKSLYVSSSTIFIGGVPVTVDGGQLRVNGSPVVGGSEPVTWNDVTDKPTFATVATSGAYGDLSGTPTLAAVATSGDYLDLSNQPSIPSLGNITFVSTTIDSSDSSGIVFTPAVTFNSDITVENELIVNNGATVSGTLNVAALNVTGTITSQGSGTPELFADNEILLTAGTRVIVSSSPFKISSYTTAGRDGLSPMIGDMIYNTSLNEFQGYTGSAWKRFNVDLSAVATSGDYLDLSNTPTIPDIGDISFVGTAIDSGDSSSISFVPAVVFNSDVTVENELFVNNNITANNFVGNVTGAIIPRSVNASATTGAITPNSDITDIYVAENLTDNITINTPSGTPVNGQKLLIRLKDNGTGRLITWTSTSGAFRAIGVLLPTTTVASKTTYVGCVYNSTDSFWDVIATVTQA